VSDHVKVLDFGLVKDPGDASNASVTNTNALIGTPSYMAPESILDPASVAAAADLYSVGAVAYFLLAGEPVFGGATTMEVCLRHVHEAPVPLSARSNRTIPPALEQLVHTCLSKSPAQRPASALELCQSLLELEKTLIWSPREADDWWRYSARDAMSSTRAAHATPGPSPGPLTLAIDWAARAAPTVAS
jgi:serine/threonine-protein kinase